MTKLILASFLFSFFITPLQNKVEKGNLKVVVKELKNNDGLVGIRIYKNKEGFPTDGEKAFQEIFVKPSGKQAVFEVPELAFGTYAIGAIHDENSNKEFDKNFIGFPKEGFGASNDPKVVLTPPSFEKSKFEFTQSGQSITFNMKYF